MPETLLIYNARVLTADPRRPRAEAVLLRGERIAFVGSTADAAALSGPAARRLDAGGCTLLPGFIDSHYHLLLGSLEMDDIPLAAVDSLPALRQAVLTYAADHSHKTWLVGQGLRYDVVGPDQPLTRQHLDAIEPDRPLVLVSYCGHTVWANTCALKQAGLLHGKAPAPVSSGEENSLIVMGEDGLAAGELREIGAYGALLDLIPSPPPAEQQRLLRQGLALAARCGITSVHNMDGDPDDLEVYAALDRLDELTLRVYLPLSLEPGVSLAALDQAAARINAYRSPRLKGGAVKCFMDGVVESGSALLLDESGRGYHGMAQYSLAQFTELAAACDRRGLQIAVHAAGDGAVRRTLDAFEAVQRLNGQRDSRHRLEHIELIHPDDLPRLARLGVIASMQPLHAPLSFPVPGDPWPERVGRAAWGRSFAWQSLRRAGVRLVFGSDWSVVSPNPLLGLHAALTRRAWAPGLPTQRQTLLNALAAYSRDAAYAEFSEQDKGCLRPGFLADLVLLSADLEHTPAEDLPGLQVLMTLLGGEIVYQA